MANCILQNISQNTNTQKVNVFCKTFCKTRQPIKNHDNNLIYGNNVAVYVGFRVKAG